MSVPRSHPQLDDSRPPEAVEVLLVRHGASEAVVEGQRDELLEGQADPSLSPEGRRQAQRVATVLAGEGLTALFITPLCRTAQTAAPVAEATGLTHARSDNCSITRLVVSPDGGWWLRSFNECGHRAAARGAASAAEHSP